MIYLKHYYRRSKTTFKLTKIDQFVSFVKKNELCGVFFFTGYSVIIDGFVLENIPSNPSQLPDHVYAYEADDIIKHCGQRGNGEDEQFLAIPQCLKTSNQ